MQQNKDIYAFALLGIFIILGYFLICLVSPIFEEGPVRISSDGLAYYAHLRSLMIDRDLHYENEFRDFNEYKHDVPNHAARTKTNHTPNKYSIGPALLWLPLFILAHLSTYLANLSGFGIPLDGYSIFYQFFICFGSIIYGFLGLFFIYKITRRFFKREIATASTIAVTLATNVFYYFVNESSMPHILSMFSVSLFVYIWIRDYGKKKAISYLYLGLISGLMISVRYQNGLFMILPLFEMIDITFSNKLPQKKVLPSFINGCFYLGVVLISLTPQFIVWKIIYGGFPIHSYNLSKFNFLAPRLFETLFSSRHGLISWTPIILFSLAGLYYFIKKHRNIGYFFLICFMLQWYINSSWWNWHFGNAFGGRAFINCTFIFVVGLSAVIERCYSKRTYLFALFSVLIIWNLLFIAQYILELIPQGDYISWKAMIRNQFEVIPYTLSKL